MSEPVQDWRTSLPEALRAEASLKDIKDVSALAQSYVETKKLVGGSIRPPGPDAAPEARKEFIEKLQKHAPELVFIPEEEKARAEVEASIWGRLGRPKEAKEYAPPTEVDLPAAALEQLRAEAVEEGLTKAQFQARAKRAAAQIAAGTKAQAEEWGALKKDLGLAYDERLAGAAEAARKLGADDGEVAAIKAGQAPATYVRRLLAVSKAFGEAREGAAQGGNGGGGRLTPAEAQLQMAEIRARKDYWDGSNPALKAKALELAKLAYPEE